MAFATPRIVTGSINNARSPIVFYGIGAYRVEYLRSNQIKSLAIIFMNLTATYNKKLEVVPKPHCKDNSIYVIPERKLRGLIPNFYIHISVSDLYIPTIGPPIFLQPNRQTDQGNV
jgi:hypothetical protein